MSTHINTFNHDENLLSDSFDLEYFGEDIKGYI